MLHRHKPLLLSTWPGVLFSVRFNNFRSFYQSNMLVYSSLLFSCAFVQTKSIDSEESKSLSYCVSGTPTENPSFHDHYSIQHSQLTSHPWEPSKWNTLDPSATSAVTYRKKEHITSTEWLYILVCVQSWVEITLHLRNQELEWSAQWRVLWRTHNLSDFHSCNWIVHSLQSERMAQWRGRLSATNFSSENNLLTFRLNAPVVITAKVKRCEQTLLFIAIHYTYYTCMKCQVIFKAQVGNR